MLKNFELRLENEPIDNPSRNIKLFNHLDIIDRNCKNPSSLNKFVELSEHTTMSYSSVSSKYLTKLFIVGNNWIQVTTNHMYLATDKNGNIYWVRFQFSGGFGYFKVMSRFVLDNNGLYKFVREKGKILIF